MTAFSTVLGTLPIALALGSGAESRVPMGLAVIGGLAVGTFLTLYVIPALYTYLASPDASPSLGEETDDPMEDATPPDAETETTGGAGGDGATDDLPDDPPARAVPEAGGDGAPAEAAPPPAEERPATS